MDSSSGTKSRKNFYISLDQTQDYSFKDGDIVSGKCCLLSSLDEDVGSITISFHGTAKVRFTVAEKLRLGDSEWHRPQNNYDSKDVLFSETKLLYQGPYTLRKNVLYEWPFQFQFPYGPSLPQSGRFGKDPFHLATIAYELEACRGRTSQDVALLEKRITPVGKDKYASMQSRTLFERIGSFTGMIATVPLLVSPPRQGLTEPSVVVCGVDRKFPIRSSQASGSHNHGLSGLFHSHQGSDTEGRITLNLPRQLIHDTSTPILLRIETAADIAPVTLQTLELYLKASTTVISNLGLHRHAEESKITLFSQTKIDLPLPTNSTLDIGRTLNLQVNPTTIPTFTYARVEVSYSLQAQLVIECGGQKYKENFAVDEVQVMSNRSPNSPLRRDHLCVFTPGYRKEGSELPRYSGTPSEADGPIDDAYLCLSRILTDNFIPHKPVASRTGEPTILLHGLLQLPDGPPASSLHENPFRLMFQTEREDALKDDQRLLDYILNAEAGFEATSLRSGTANLERFSYTWISPNAPQLSLKERVRGLAVRPSTNIEISALDAANPSSSEAPPPPYSMPMDHFSPISLLNKRLRLIADWQQPDASLLASEAEYVINEHGKELQSRVHEIDSRPASIAAAKSETLRGLLMGLEVELTGNGALDTGKGEQGKKWRNYPPDGKGKEMQ